MSRPQWLELVPRDQDAFRIAVAFLEDRMARVDTFEWAL